MDSVIRRPVVSWLRVLVVGLAIAEWLIFRHVAPVPDVAWLMEGARRWMDGARLFIDVREVNPPLIFYEMVGLSGGTERSSAFVLGVVAVTLISSLWVGRHHGDLLALGVFVSVSFAGMIEFGQREHLLLIFVVPYLLARGPAWERILMGLWAFLGIGLKPYFLLVVLLPALLEAWRDRRSVFDPQKLALAGACFVYLLSAYLLYPAYFREMIPLARSVYTYGSSLQPMLILQALLVAVAIALADTERRPFAAAAVGALASYFIQGRLWPYHFIPAAGLGMILCFWHRRLVLWGLLLFIQAFQGPYLRYGRTPIPQGVERLVVLSVHPSAAYPSVTGCGARNETPWGSLGWVPGPWNTVTNPSSSTEDRKKAWAIIRRERERLRRWIVLTDTQLIISDASPRKAYFDRPIDFMRLIGPLPGFKLIRRVGRYELWAKQPLRGEYCQERY